MQYGINRRNYELVEERTKRRPQCLIDEPKLPFQLGDIWGAFWDLHASRAGGFGVAPIAISEIAAYVTLFHVQDVELFVHCIRAMDRVYLEDYAAKNPVKKDK